MYNIYKNISLKYIIFLSFIGNFLIKISITKKYFKLRLISKIQRYEEKISQEKEIHLLFKNKGKDIVFATLKLNPGVTNFTDIHLEKSQIIPEDKNQIINIYERGKDTKKDTVLIGIKSGVGFVDEIFYFTDYSTKFIFKCRILLLKSDTYKFEYIFLTFTVSKKNVTDYAYLDSSIVYPDKCFQPLFTKNLKTDTNQLTLFRDIYICTDTKSICTLHLIKLYDLKYEGNITDLISKDLFDAGDLNRYGFSIFIPHQKLNIIISVKNSREEYPESSFYPSTAINACDHMSCLNEGTCSVDSTTNNAKCECPTGFFGVSCEHQYSCGLCYPEHCELNLKCKSCPIGARGASCRQLTCDGIKMCSDQGKCIPKDHIRKCLCDSGWSGDLCTHRDCEKGKPCLNGGKCILHVAVEKCYCPEGYIGEFCEIKTFSSHALKIFGFTMASICIAFVIITIIYFLYIFMSEKNSNKKLENNNESVDVNVSKTDRISIGEYCSFKNINSIVNENRCNDEI